MPHLNPTRFDAATECALVGRYREHNDRRALDRLVAAHQDLVGRTARAHRSPQCPAADLIQEGNLGLLAAIERFDPARGIRLASYAQWWVRAFILRFIERNTRLVRGATTSERQRVFYRLARTSRELTAAGQDDSAAAIAGALGVSEDDVTAMQLLRAPARSLGTPGGATPEDPTPQLADPRESPEQLVHERELGERLEDALRRFDATLSGRAREMFRDRVRAPHPASLGEMCRRWNVTRPVAKRIEARVRQPLCRFLYREIGDTVAATLGHV